MKRRGVWQALLFLAALTAVSCGPETEGLQPDEARTATQTAQLRFKPIRRALVLSARAQGEAPSREALAAEGAGLRAQVVTPVQWRVMTAEQFKGYSALIIGDEACTEDSSGTLQTATDTRRIWGPVIDGNIFVIASDPSTNHTPTLVERGVEFATAKEDATGLYVSLGCAYQRAAPDTSVPLLETFGDFLVAGMGCHTAAHVFTMSPKELTGDLYGADNRLIGDGCAARTVFTHYPEQTFGTAALAVDTEGSMPGAQPYVDPFWDGSRGGLFVGTPYILARGGLPQIPNRPPEARCKDLVLDANEACGANESVNNGSSDPDGDLVGCTQSPAGPYPLGSTTVTLTCTDSQQQSSSCTATVQVRDVTAPELALVGPTSQQAECGASYADPGATANDFCDGDLGGAIVRSGQVDAGTLGAYGLTYDVEDSSGNRAPSVMRTVNVSDTLPPVLTLHPPLDQMLECGMPYIDPGFTVIDQCFGDLSTIVRTGTVNSNAPGSYVMTYSAADPVGNPSRPQSRSVSVIDTLPPSIRVVGPIEDSYECGTTYVDPGATANDQCAGAVPAVATRTGNPLGSFTITYSASDPSGNSSTSPDRRRVTMTDQEPPVLTLSGPATQVVECGRTPYADPGATATDQCFGNLTSHIVRTGLVTAGTPGTYPLTYSVTDPAGNSAVPVNRTVTVVDTIAPTVTIGGPHDPVVECDCGATYPDNVFANDLCAGPLPVERSGRVDMCTGGSYTVTYTVRDPSGNGGTFSRTVRVIDTLRPVVTLNGPGSITIVQGMPWVDPGASAQDACAGEVLVTRDGHVNTDVPDTYVLRYRAVDVAGNRMDAFRTVIVVPATSGIASRTSTPAR